MRLKIQIAIVILIATLMHCKNNHEKPKKFITIDNNITADVKFNLNKRIIVPDLVFPRIAISRETKKIYVYGESKVHKKKIFIVNIYNENLECISEKTFSYGQGPGDVGATNIITPYKENIFICENSNLRVSLYDGNFNYLRSSRYHDLETCPFEMIENGRFFIAAILESHKRKRSHSFRIGSFPSMKTKEFYKTEPQSPYDEKHRFLAGETDFSFFYNNNYIYILLMKKYQILKFDLNCNKQNDLTVKVRLMKTPRELKDQFMADQGYKGKSYSSRITFSKTITPTSWMVQLKKGFIVIRREDYFNKCTEFANGDYFSYELKFLGKVKVPCFFEIFKIKNGFHVVFSTKYDNNFLYLVNEVDEDIYLEKWEVSE